jgi:hypothetical protein
MAVFRRLLHLARSLHTLLAWPTDRPAAVSGRHKMTFNFASLQHIAISAVGAVFAATLFITAAVGPAGQIF